MDAKLRGGFFKGLRRKLTGESFFLTYFGAEGEPGVVAFAGRVPGKIMALDLRGGKQFILQKDSFLCAEDQVDFNIAFQKKLEAALFEGEGLILQGVWGEGLVFVNGCGDFVELNLQLGQIVKVSTSHAVG